jgi:SPOR domain
MADNRKSFRPRRLAFGERLVPRGRLAAAAFALALLAGTAPAQAQDASAGLRTGTASLAAGKYDAAVRELSATVNDDSASTSEAAKALYLRGIAYRKLGQPARAIADLGAAIWLGLPTSDKVRSQVNKGLAYRAAGLSSQAEAEMAEARRASSSSEVEKIIAEDGGGTAVASADSNGSPPPGSETPAGSGPFWSKLVPSFGGTSSAPPPAPPPAASPKPSTTRTAEAAPAGNWSTSVSSESAPQSGNSVSRWFGSLTGSSSDTTPAPAPAAAPANEPSPPPRQRTAELPSTSSWAANTETEKVVSRTAPSSGSTFGRWFSRSSETGSAPPASTGGGYTVQLANSRSEAEAKALWKKVSSENQQLASAQPQIEKVDIGSFGTFYSLKIGPFSGREESAKLCSALKRSGTDCSVVSPEGP